jgi:glycosyltransferase involved in cell wall biosynthesis
MDECKASIIIPTKDKLSRLRLILKFLENQITDGIEVIIVFDGCHPQTVSGFENYRFSFNPLKIINITNIGRSAARNLGIKLASGKIIIFLDDDRIPCADFVQKHLAGQQEPCILLGGRNNVSMTEKEIESLFFSSTIDLNYQEINNRANIAGELTPKIRRRFLFRLDGPLRWMNFFTGNVSIPRKDFIETGGFDENFRGWGHEDLELGYRLCKQGLHFKKDTGIETYHLVHSVNMKDKFNESRRNLKYMIQKCRGDLAANLILRAKMIQIYLERFTDFL